MGEKKEYIGVWQEKDLTWSFVVAATNGEEIIQKGFTTTKIAALHRDEYIVLNELPGKRNFPLKRFALMRMRNEPYEEMFGSGKK